MSCQSGHLPIERGWSTESKKAMWLISAGVEGSNDNGGDREISGHKRDTTEATLRVY